MANTPKLLTYRDRDPSADINIVEIDPSTMYYTWCRPCHYAAVGGCLGSCIRQIPRPPPSAWSRLLTWIKSKR